MVKTRTSHSMDYMKALDILYPYKLKLEIIKLAYLNEEFDSTLSADMKEPYDMITYFRESEAYDTYNIKSVAKALNHKIKELDFLSYSFIGSVEMEHKHGCNLPCVFDGDWTLTEVYQYLIHLFDLDDYVVIENSILNGDILGILNCFLIRL